MLASLTVPLALFVGSAQAARAAPAQSAGARVPHITGWRLEEGEALLQLYGLRWNDLPGVLDAHKWVICTQRPRAGAVVPIGTLVRLRVARPGRC